MYYQFFFGQNIFKREKLFTISLNTNFKFFILSLRKIFNQKFINS